MPERFLPIHESLFIQFPDIRNLIDRSKQGDMVECSRGTYRLISNKIFLPDFFDYPPIAGALGLMALDPVSKNGIAVMGYNVLLFEHELFAQVVHTPQGFTTNRSDKRRLMTRTTFREDMLKDFMDILYSYQFKGIRVLSAQWHPKVRGGLISEERGIDIIDQVAWNAGITQSEQHHWVLRFT